MFRFTLRDVLWQMVVVGLGISLLLTTWRMSVLQARHAALKKQLDAVIAVAHDTAELSIDVRADGGIHATMPRNWPQSLVDRWQPIAPPAQPLPPGAEYPVGRLTR
jgi:hypothetical protein